MRPVPPHRDAYGHQIWDYLHGGSPLEVVERDDGFVSVAASTAMYFAGLRDWTKPEQKAIGLAHGETALDVGCGAGRVALHLQHRGFRVTAIDNSPLVVSTAKARGVADARVLPFESIGTLGRHRFDTVVMFGNNFGLFASARRARSLLRELHRITRAGAVLLAQSLDPHETNELAHLQYQRRNRQRGRMPGQIRIRVRFHQFVGPWFDYLLVSPAEMSGLVEGTGWELDRFLTDGSPRYVGIIRRGHLPHRPKALHRSIDDTKG